jgi:hypothetical protein
VTFVVGGDEALAPRRPAGGSGSSCSGALLVEAYVNLSQLGFSWPDRPLLGVVVHRVEPDVAVCAAGCRW